MTKCFLNLCAMVLALALGACAGPRADRVWFEYLAPTAHVEMDEARFSVRPVSDWAYTAEGPRAQSYIEAGYDLAALRRVWFVLEPQPGSAIAAHTFLLFEFEGDRLLGLTIEARREADEKYSAVAGVFNAYELSYVWGSARDLLTRRAVMLAHDVFVYPTAVTDAQQRALLARLLERTQTLAARPRFYNTLFSNCTNELAKAAGFHWAPAFILTGTSDEYLFSRGIIPGDEFAAARARADMAGFVRGLNAAPAADFDRLLLVELRRRAELTPNG